MGQPFTAALRALQVGQRVTLNGETFAVVSRMPATLNSKVNYTVRGGFGHDAHLEAETQRGAFLVPPFGMGERRAIKTVLIDGVEPAATPKRSEPRAAAKPAPKRKAAARRKDEPRSGAQGADKRSLRLCDIEGREDTEKAAQALERQAQRAGVEANANRGALKSRIENLQRLNDAYRLTNEAIGEPYDSDSRSGDDNEQARVRLGKLGYGSRDIQALLTPDDRGLVGIPATATLEARSRLSRLEQRATALENSGADGRTEWRGGVQVEQQCNQVGIHFPAPPDAQMITELKRGRFRQGAWSRVWQRAASSIAWTRALSIAEFYDEKHGDPKPKKRAKAVPKRRTKAAPKKRAKAGPKTRAKPASTKRAKVVTKKAANAAPKKRAKAAPKKRAKAAPKKSAKAVLGLAARSEQGEWPDEVPNAETPKGQFELWRMCMHGQTYSAFKDEIGDVWRCLHTFSTDFEPFERSDGRVVVLHGRQHWYYLVEPAEWNPHSSKRWLVWREGSKLSAILEALDLRTEESPSGRRTVYELGRSHREKDKVVFRGNVAQIANWLIDSGRVRDMPRMDDVQLQKALKAQHARQTNGEAGRIHRALYTVEEKLKGLEANPSSALAATELKKLNATLDALAKRIEKKVITRDAETHGSLSARILEVRTLHHRVVAAVDNATPSRVHEGDENYAHKREARIDRLFNQAERKKEASEQAFKVSKDLVSHRCPGQPILVGHHSEKRDRRRLERSINQGFKGLELSREADELERRAVGAESSTAIQSDNPDAVSLILDKIARIETNQARAKAINKAIGRPLRGSKRTEAQNERARKRLRELGHSDARIEELLTPDFMGRVGIPGYGLTGYSQEIARLKKRLVLMEKNAAAMGAEKWFGEVRVVQEENRVRMFFPKRPDKAFRKKLARSGFRDAYSIEAFQKHASSGAWFDAEKMANQYAAEMKDVAKQDAERE